MKYKQDMERKNVINSLTSHKEKKIDVAVLMSAYNEQAGISRAIQSILDQTYTDWKLVVIDDDYYGHMSSIKVDSVLEDYREPAKGEKDEGKKHM